MQQTRQPLNALRRPAIGLNARHVMLLVTSSHASRKTIAVYFCRCTFLMMLHTWASHICTLWEVHAWFARFGKENIKRSSVGPLYTLNKKRRKPALKKQNCTYWNMLETWQGLQYQQISWNSKPLYMGNTKNTNMEHGAFNACCAIWLAHLEALGISRFLSVRIQPTAKSNTCSTKRCRIFSCYF